MGTRRLIISFGTLIVAASIFLSCNRTDPYGMYRIDCNESAIDTMYINTDTSLNSLLFLLCMSDSGFMNELCNLRFILEKGYFYVITDSDTNRTKCQYEIISDSMTYIICQPGKDTLFLHGKREKKLKTGLLDFRLKKN